MIVITYLAYPTADHEEWESIGGAYINAYIVQPTLELADLTARKWISADHWQIKEMEEWKEISRENYEDSDPSIKYFDQALIDKEVYVYHTWPHGGDEDEISH